MLATSREFMEAVKADARQWFGKVEVTWTDSQIDQSVIITATENANVSRPKHAADGLEEVPHKWLSLDGSCNMDGSYHFMPSTAEQAILYQVGWWGRQLAGAGGAFSSPYPTLRVSFLPKPLIGLRVVGDSMREEYPVDFDVRIYENDVLSHTENVTGNDEVVWDKDIVDLEITEATRLELELHKWSHEGRQAKIIEFFTAIQETYFDDDILSLTLQEERELSEGSLPIGNISANELDIQLNNITDKFHPGNPQSPIRRFIQKNRRVRAWIGLKLPEGITEYIPLGVYWTGDWNVPEGEIYAATSARDLLESLRATTFSSSEVYQNKTLYELTEIVIQDAQIELGYTFPYWIDPELNGADFLVPWAWFPRGSHRRTLKDIAAAALGQVYQDRDGVLRVEGPSFIQMPEEES